MRAVLTHNPRNRKFTTGAIRPAFREGVAWRVASNYHGCLLITQHSLPVTEVFAVFLVRAAYSEQMDLRATVEQARAFFGDLRNFVELMPGVERITAEAGGVARWLIHADVPIVGAIRQAFAVAQAVNAPGRIEWTPARGEQQNLLRYAATFEERADGVRVRIEQHVELRRQHARELHLLAGLAGATRLSAEMQKGVTQMMRTFLQRARARLEK